VVHSVKGRQRDRGGRGDRGSPGHRLDRVSFVTLRSNSSNVTSNRMTVQGIPKVARVACGEHHTLAICEKGNVFAWGAGTYGQLGDGNCEVSFLLPYREINSFGVPIQQVACGHYHSLALCEDGALYSWGQNSYGQLGLGGMFYSQLSPNLVASLSGIPLAQIAAGGAHSFALSLSGAVFSWGNNNCGQLGLSNTEKTFTPRSVTPLKRLSLNVTYIACGGEHTALLTKDGSMFTCGNGENGQLGYNAPTNAVVFQRVERLQGEVSQIACGR
uniref:Uncharacterized protein n=1 Tax=Callorhinchus milii TaxID=7868 RepID=A0A4W3IDD3_CALMI